MLFRSMAGGDNIDNYKTIDGKPYKAAIRALNLLKDASDKGDEVIVVATYLHLNNNIVIGTAKKNSFCVEKILCKDRDIELKTLMLENTFQVEKSTFPLLFSLQPPYATLCIWEKGRLAVNSYYKYLCLVKQGQRPVLPVKLELLNPWQLEILCEEWLRINNRLAYKIAQTGRSMKDIDIIGTTKENKLIIGQVSFSGNQKKLDKLALYAQNACSCDSYYFDSRLSISNLNFSNTSTIAVSIEDVFSSFIKEQRSYVFRLIYGFSVNE